MLAPFPFMGLARDWSFYTPYLLSKEEALQDISRYEVQEPAWVEIFTKCQVEPGDERMFETKSIAYGQQP